MHKYFTWIAIFCSLIAGTFASEFVSSFGELPVDNIPEHAASHYNNDESPTKVALGGMGVDFTGSLNN